MTDIAGKISDVTGETPETWKPVPGLDGYEASDMGALRSVDRVLPDGRRRKGVVLAQRASNRGYQLANVAGKTRTVHSLVLLAFKGPPPPGMVGRHLNDNQQDNRAVNLEYGTPAENEGDKFANGTRNRAEPKPEKACLLCGGPVVTNGKRCTACLIVIGLDVRSSLEVPRGAPGYVTLDDLAKRWGYPSVSGLLELARRAGYGYPPPSRSVMARVAARLRSRRGHPQ